MKKNLVIGFYSHPEYYPPSLNAIEYLAREYDMIYIIHRNYPSFNWPFPENVRLISNGKPTRIRDVENSGTLQKIALFFRFAWILLRYMQKVKPDTVLLYDSIPVLAYRLARPFAKKPRVLWYHNHDVADANALQKYSIGWWSVKAEKWIFPLLDIFSLPAEARKVYFPLDTLKGTCFFVPNFPSRKVYEKYFNQPRVTGKIINFTYQGFLGTGHGLEEIVEYILPRKEPVLYQLYLKGLVDEGYKQSLTALAEKCSVADQLFFQGFIPYADMPASNNNNHIGIAIYKDIDIMKTTIGTASNKIYEYAASAMPVLVYDNAYFRNALEQYPWIFFTDTSAASLQSCIEAVLKNYEEASRAALADFRDKLNFEHYFQPLLSALNKMNRGAA